jgi:hypothetical protein
MSWCDPSIVKVWQEDTRKNPVFLAHCQAVDIIGYVTYLPGGDFTR